MTTKPSEGVNDGEITTEWIEKPLSHVTNYFVEGFKPIGQRIINHESFVDTQKQKVVFRLTLQSTTERNK